MTSISLSSSRKELTPFAGFSSEIILAGGCVWLSPEITVCTFGSAGWNSPLLMQENQRDKKCLGSLGTESSVQNKFSPQGSEISESLLCCAALISRHWIIPIMCGSWFMLPTLGPDTQTCTFAHSSAGHFVPLKFVLLYYNIWKKTLKNTFI